MKEPYFSIVTPIYNCEKYLHQCLDSVISQTFGDWELILVNDGSTDRSGEICEHYVRAYADRRITYIEQPNGGVSAARNTALNAATGKYIVFLDSDDWLEIDVLRKVYDMPEVDCYVGMFFSEFETENAIPIFTEKMESHRMDGFSRKEVLEYFHQLRLILTVWRIMPKREILVQNGVAFELNLVHEDEVFAALTIACCDTFRLIPDKFYHYRFRPNSITTSKTLFNYVCYIRVAQLLIEAAINKYDNAENRDRYLFLLRVCSENLGMARGGIDYWALPIHIIKEGRKFLGLKELM